MKGCRAACVGTSIHTLTLMCTLMHAHAFTHTHTHTAYGMVSVGMSRLQLVLRLRPKCLWLLQLCGWCRVRQQAFLYLWVCAEPSLPIHH